MAILEAQKGALLQELGKRFSMPPDSSVTTYLADHQMLSQMLLDAMPPLKECFGTDAVFALRAPLDESGSRTLYAVAMWPGSLQEVRAALSRFEDSWWLTHSEQASELLVLHTSLCKWRLRPFDWSEFLGLAEELSRRRG